MDNIDDQIDRIYAHFDDLFLAGNFQQADQELLAVDIGVLPVDVALAYLTICNAAKSKLQNYASFYDSVKRKAEIEGCYSVDLLSGLEPVHM